jgi:phosphatidylinositol kinase/protein kinase (PI-3  family)
VSCWSELNEDQQDELIRSIELALTSQDIAEVTQTLLNLAEFMEHSDKVSHSSIVQVEDDKEPAGGKEEASMQPTLVCSPSAVFL